MKFFVVACAILAVAAAQYGHGQNEHKNHVEEYVDYRAHPHYNYHYGVHDLKTHDIKNQWEARDGHNVKGSYSLQQPDGRKRIVEYEADKDGIHYNVKYEGHAIHEEGHHGGHEQSHGHGKSSSSQYHKARTNYHGESSHNDDHNDYGSHGHQASSYSNHVTHHQSHGYEHY